MGNCLSGSSVSFLALALVCGPALSLRSLVILDRGTELADWVKGSLSGYLNLQFTNINWASTEKTRLNFLTYSWLKSTIKTRFDRLMLTVWFKIARWCTVNREFYQKTPPKRRKELAPQRRSILIENSEIQRTRSLALRPRLGISSEFFMAWKRAEKLCFSDNQNVNFLV